MGSLVTFKITHAVFGCHITQTLSKGSLALEVELILVERIISLSSGIFLISNTILISIRYRTQRLCSVRAEASTQIKTDLKIDLTIFLDNSPNVKSNLS